MSENHTQCVPLLADTQAGRLSRKPSNCELQQSCFLSDGRTSAGRDSARRVQTKLTIAIILATVFLVVEVIGGYLAQSVAIMADAAHMLSDVVGFGVSLTATWVMTWRSHHSYSFGYHRAEIIGALFSTLIIWAVTGALLWEAVQRVINPQPVDGKIMFIVACAGIVFNIVLGLALGHDRHQGLGGHDNADHHRHDHSHSKGPATSSGQPAAISTKAAAPLAAADAPTGVQPSNQAVEGPAAAESLNMRGAILHVLGDLIQSVGVAIAGLLIWMHPDDPHWVLADPICTFAFAILVLLTTYAITCDIICTLMERAPAQYDIEEMTAAMNEIEGVRDVHDLHVWNLSTGIAILSAHVHAHAGACTNQVLHHLEQFVRKRGIQHSTVQIFNPVGQEQHDNDNHYQQSLDSYAGISDALLPTRPIDTLQHCHR